MGETVRFPSNGDLTDGYLARPREASPPGVVVIQEWWGLDDHIRSVADRFAVAGFLALAPDLFHGKVTRSPDEASRLLMALNIAQAERDLRGAVEYLKGSVGRPVGTVGFCMGGALSLFAACSNPASVGACVVYYGGHPRVEYDIGSLKAPLLGHYAAEDPSVNPRRPALEEELKARGRPYEFHTYPGTRHAFFNDTRPAYHKEAAEESWKRTVSFFRQHL